MKAYEHSGIVPVSGALMAVGAGSLAALLLGVVYTFAFYHILYVYLNVLFTFGFGAGIGWTVGFAAREGKIRNVPVVGGLALVAAFVGLYSAWGTTAYALVPSSELKQFWQDAGLWPFMPHNIVALMGKLYSAGSWGMTANAPVHGLPLLDMWVIEAGIIGAMANALSVQQIQDLPFCEGCDEWVVGRESFLFAGNGYGSVWSDVKHGVFENLAQTPRASGDETHYVELTVSVCPKCDASNYLSVVACENRVNPKGGRYKVKRKIATNIPLTTAQAEIVDAAAFMAPAIGSEPVAADLADWSTPS